MMRVNWIFQGDYRVDPALDLDAMKSIGPFWGSWQTWRSCGTDNVICHDFAKSRELIDRKFHEQCNFYVSARNYPSLGRPQQVILYDGEFGQEIKEIEDIIACHLASDQSDIVLLTGFDLSKPQKSLDPYQNHDSYHYLSLINSIIQTKTSVQWVVIDHPIDLDDRFRELPNLTCDTMANVLKLLDQ